MVLLIIVYFWTFGLFSSELSLRLTRFCHKSEVETSGEGKLRLMSLLMVHFPRWVGFVLWQLWLYPVDLDFRS